MKILLTRLAAYAGRHCLRIGLIGCAMFLFSQKQIDLRVSLGAPAGIEVPASVKEPLPSVSVDSQPKVAVASSGGLLSRFNFFGGAREVTRSSRLMNRDLEVADFVSRFGGVARAEQQKFGIPTSVILAAALLNSDAGTTAAAKIGNSLFALDCGSGWTGATMENNGRCVRGYDTAWLSFRDFSESVTSGKYSRMKQFGPQDYRKWAAGLGELGLNHDPALAGDIVRVVERYDLGRFD